MEKVFKIKAEDIISIYPINIGCIASDMITVLGMKVKYAYREEPFDNYDSGWRFFQVKKIKIMLT